MLYKLYQNMGIKGKCLRIIQHWYTEMKEMVRIDDCYSRCYNLLQGTRQGGVLSPWLFTAFVNDLILFYKEELKPEWYYMECIVVHPCLQMILHCFHA